MTQALGVLIFLYVVAMHISIAAMEVLSWTTALLVIAYKFKNRSPFTFPLLSPLLGLLLWSFLSLVMNSELKPFWPQFGFMRWIVLLYTFYWSLEILCHNSKFQQTLSKVWLGALSLAGLNGIFQFFTGIDLFHSKPHLDGVHVFNATGFFSMSLTFGYVMGTSFFSSLQALKKSNWSRAAILIGFFGLIASGSRGAWIGGIMTGLIFVVLAKPRWIPIYAGAAAVLVGILSQISAKFNELLHFQAGHSTSVRLELWRSYYEIFKDNPVFGVGLFQGDKLLPQYYERLGIVETFTSHAHNVPLQWAAGTGLVGLLLYGWISFWFLKSAWTIRHQSNWGWPLLLAQVFWHCGSLTEANFFDGEVNHIIVFTWALVLTFSRNLRAQTPADES